MRLSFCGAECSIAPIYLARNRKFALNKSIYMARFMGRLLFPVQSIKVLRLLGYQLCVPVRVV